ncbi:SUMF1/EgtB/PvdO family nonheme iron enzyme [Sorangium sp. So ce327]|uniref:SUMF1/EgtB/PvdO family nonheme iron enzyme n=1 Tax=unclassified Sorangium TaxID=2621164 RepID=UPI003F63DDCA
MRRPSRYACRSGIAACSSVSTAIFSERWYLPDDLAQPAPAGPERLAPSGCRRGCRPARKDRSRDASGHTRQSPALRRRAPVAPRSPRRQSGVERALFADLQPGGSRSPRGDGRWGHADLGGNVWEWVLDSFAADDPLECDDCAVLTPDTNHMIWGGGWRSGKETLLTSAFQERPPTGHFAGAGLRCARAR